MQRLRIIVPWRDNRDVRRAGEALRVARRLGLSPVLVAVHYEGAAGILCPWDSRDALYRCFAVLVAVNRSWLRAHPETPRLYDAGVRYKPEPKGQEDWVSIPILYALGVGDCDDIGGARVAELRGGHRCKPERALPYLKQVPIGFHVQARRASGRIEDPSAILGMPT